MIFLSSNNHIKKGCHNRPPFFISARSYLIIGMVSRAGMFVAYPVYPLF